MGVDASADEEYKFAQPDDCDESYHGDEFGSLAVKVVVAIVAVAVTVAVVVAAIATRTVNASERAEKTTQDGGG